MQNISFQGKSTLFLSKEAIEHSEKLARSTSRHINPQNNSCNVSRGKIFTTNINKSSFTILVRDNEKGFLTEVPIYGKTDRYIHQLGLKLAELKASTQNKLTAWIIGGSESSVDKGSTMSTLNKVADVLCDNNHIDTSILSGLRKGEDIFAMHNNADLTQIALRAKNEEDIHKMFEIVELNNVDINPEGVRKVFNIKNVASSAPQPKPQQK